MCNNCFQHISIIPVQLISIIQHILISITSSFWLFVTLNNTKKNYAIYQHVKQVGEEELFLPLVY